MSPVPVLLDPEDLPDGLVVADADARAVVVTAEAERVLGVPAADLLGRDVREGLPWQDTSGRRWWACTDPWSGLATRRGHRERLLVLPGGREVLVTARYVRPGRGRPVSRVVLSVRPTAARRRAEQDHAGLIATVAHELRSPLTSVKGFTSTLLRRWDRFSDEQKQLMLRTVEHDADRVTRLITELLDISRIDAGRLEVRTLPVDLAAVLRGHAERAVASGLDPARIEVRVPDPGALPEVWADHDRLDQVLANLVENAVRHGDGPVRLSLGTGPLTAEHLDDAASPQADAVVVCVEDGGAGIAEAHIPLVFTKFWRGESRGGTGLGLYVVRGLVEAHGGRIVVRRSDLGGARFVLALPAGDPTAGLHPDL
ncbi:HAMP domain-containing sensor histidine kinase [Pseudokineococcus basanitobsidens]|uniref:histidine kinase n=1 Tax=Pseudokineococcus basanitobsidens TaxID=1926649 RepID=A0ABU8RP44_9ACTN